MRIRVLLCDDHAPTRGSYRSLLIDEPDIVVVGEAADGLAAVTQAEDLRPDVILMDVRMPRLDGIAATRRIASGDDPAGIIMLTTFDLDEYVFEALRAGASGFLLKDSVDEGLADAVRIVHRGDALLSPSVTRRVVTAFASRRPQSHAGFDSRLRELSGRETEVLVLVGRALSNVEIARRLGVEETTVKTYVSRILAKLGLRNRVEMVVRAQEHGLI